MGRIECHTCLRAGLSHRMSNVIGGRPYNCQRMSDVCQTYAGPPPHTRQTLLTHVKDAAAPHLLPRHLIKGPPTHILAVQGKPGGRVHSPLPLSPLPLTSSPSSPTIPDTEERLVIQASVITGITNYRH